MAMDTKLSLLSLGKMDKNKLQQILLSGLFAAHLPEQMGEPRAYESIKCLGKKENT